MPTPSTPRPNLKRICLLSQAAKAVKLPRKQLEDYLEESVGGCYIVEPRGEILCWPGNIARDIKAYREMLEDDGPETIPEMKALALKFKELAAWMKTNDFTHFIEDIRQHDVQDQAHS